MASFRKTLPLMGPADHLMCMEAAGFQHVQSFCSQGDKLWPEESGCGFLLTPHWEHMHTWLSWACICMKGSGEKTVNRTLSYLMCMPGSTRLVCQREDTASWDLEYRGVEEADMVPLGKRFTGKHYQDVLYSPLNRTYWRFSAFL